MGMVEVMVGDDVFVIGFDDVLLGDVVHLRIEYDCEETNSGDKGE